MPKHMWLIGKPVDILDKIGYTTYNTDKGEFFIWNVTKNRCHLFIY